MRKLKSRLTSSSDRNRLHLIYKNKGIKTFYFRRVFFIILLFSSCLYCYDSNSQYVPADYVVMANDISAKVQKILSERYKMKVVGVTNGLADCVNVLGLSFQILGQLSKEELRIILVGSVEEFLNQINSHAEIRPFLINYPFTANEITITLFIKNKKGQSLYHPDISVAYSSDDNISFNTVNINNVYAYESRERETYETAFKIVNEKNKK